MCRPHYLKRRIGVVSDILPTPGGQGRTVQSPQFWVLCFVRLGLRGPIQLTF